MSDGHPWALTHLLVLPTPTSLKESVRVTNATVGVAGAIPVSVADPLTPSRATDTLPEGDRRMTVSQADSFDVQ